MSNKIHGFIRKFLTLKRDSFVKNKRTYNVNKVKYNFNKIATRRNHILIKRPFTFYGGGGPKQCGLLFVFITTFIGIYNNQKK